MMRLRSVGDEPEIGAEGMPERIVALHDAAEGRERVGPLLDPADERVDPLVIAAFDPEDPVSQAARQLRAKIVAARKVDGSAVRMIAMIGVDAAAETALAVANTATACAQAGYATLLIDAGVDTPTQHGLFRQDNAVGLTTLLGQSDRGLDGVRATAISGLSLLAAGPALPNGEQMFDRGALFRRLRAGAERYDLVLALADGPNPAGIAEGFDGALIVVRRDVSSSRVLQALVRDLGERQVSVLGVVYVS